MIILPNFHGTSKDAPGVEQTETNAFSPLKQRLAAGQDSVVFVNADSTGYSADGIFYHTAVEIGALHDATVILYLWAEWVDTAPTGPKAWKAPVTLRTGAGPKLTIYQAATPGQVPGYAFDGARRSAMIDAIPTPHLCIMHQGHNAQSFEVNAPGLNTVGAGLFMGALGMTELKWPGVAQLVTTQNPWRDNTNYLKVYQAISGVVTAHPGVTLADSYADFQALNKAGVLYRPDGLHPTDSATNSAGADVVTSRLLALYHAAIPGAFTTPSWPTMDAPSLLDNTEFENWGAGAMPLRWQANFGLTATKDTTNVYSARFPYSMALYANGNPNGKNSSARAIRYFSTAELAKIRGKTISVAMLVKVPRGQPFYGAVIIKTGGATRTLTASALVAVNDDWAVMTLPAVPVDDVALADFSCYISLSPAFFTDTPLASPVYVQKIVVVEGALPKGMLPALPTGRPTPGLTYQTRVQDSTPTGHVNLDIIGNYLYTINQNKKLLIYSLTNPALPTLVGSVTDTTNLNGAGGIRVSPDGNRAYVSCEAGAAMTVWDVSNKSAPVFVATQRGPTPGTSLAGASNLRLNAAGTLCLVTTITRNSLALIDITNPAAPTWIKEVTGLNGARDVFLSKDEKTAYVTCDAASNMYVIDITNPATAVSVKTVTDGTYGSLARGIVMNAAGTRLFTMGPSTAGLSWVGSIGVWDISGANQNAPLNVSGYLGTASGTPGYIAGGRGMVLSPDEQYLYATSESGDNFSIFDISKETAIRLIEVNRGNVVGTDLDAAFGLKVKAGYAYIACYTGAASPAGRGIAVVKIDPFYGTPA